MTIAMTESTDPQSAGSDDALEAARREKLRKLEALGVDPWGARFDAHRPIGANPAVGIGNRHFAPRRRGTTRPATRAAGSSGRPHCADARHGQADFRQHPRLDRPDSALHRQKASRRSELGRLAVLRFGRHHRRRRRIEANQNRRADDFRRRFAVPYQIAGNAPRQIPRHPRSGTAAAAAISGFNPRRRRAATVFEPHQNRAIDPANAGRRGVRRGRGTHARMQSPAERPPGRS